MSHVPNPYINQGDFGLLGEKKFIIDATWWRTWCDYVNFTPETDTPQIREDISYRDELCQDTEEDEEYDPFKDVNYGSSGFQRQHKKLKLSLQEQISMATIDLALEGESGIEESQLFYERPGKIVNTSLLDSKFVNRNWLKRTLVEHFDYEVVCQKVWLHLYSWYSADVTICRKLVKDH